MIFFYEWKRKTLSFIHSIHNAIKYLKGLVLQICKLSSQSSNHHNKHLQNTFSCICCRLLMHQKSPPTPSGIAMCWIVIGWVKFLNSGDEKRDNWTPTLGVIFMLCRIIMGYVQNLKYGERGMIGHGKPISTFDCYLFCIFIYILIQ